jgi:hypothetical protein
LFEFAYLKATLTAIANCLPQSRFDDLLPWNFTRQDNLKVAPSNRLQRACQFTVTRKVGNYPGLDYAPNTGTGATHCPKFTAHRSSCAIQASLQAAQGRPILH